VACTVSYDGTAYHGWQRQPRERSVQEVIESSLRQLHNGEDIVIYGASRTDQGVHALGQVFHFDTTLAIPIERFALAINTYLPADIFVTHARIVDSNFHARKSVTKKTYCYKLMLNQYIPHERHRMGYFKGTLNVPSMQTQLNALVGTHDFSAFTQHAQYDSYERTIHAATLTETDYGVELVITGSGFLRHMVRIIMGTLLLVGTNPLVQMSDVLASKDRQQAGLNVAPEGLYLLQVDYE
jgi:tRNA pseudouridine38-40 synthase